MSKINKLGKSTFVIAILSFLLVAVLAFGGTYAYFSDAAKADATSFTMGRLKLSSVTAETTITAEANIAVPNQPIFTTAKPVTADVDSTITYFVRFTLDIGTPVLKGTHAQTEATACEDAATQLLSVGAVAGWQQDGTTGVYYLLTAQAADADVSIPLDVKVNSAIGANSSQHWMDADISINIKVEVIQASYITGNTAVEADTAVELDTLKTAFTTAAVKTVA